MTTVAPGPTSVPSPDQPGLYIIDADGTNLRRLSREAAYRPVWSPDGRRIAYESSEVSGQFRVIDWNGNSHPVDGQLTNGRTGVVWSPDSTHLAFPGAGADGTPPARDIWVVRADGSDAARPIRAAGDDAVVDWGPDGRLVSVSEQGMFVFSADGATRTRIWDRNLGDPGDLAWSPDGAMVYVQPSGQYVTAVVAADGSTVHILREGGDTTRKDMVQADWTTDNHIVGRCSGTVICRSQPDGTWIWEHPFNGYDLDAAPTGRNVAYFRSTPEGYRGEIRVIDSGTGADHSVVVAPAGKSLTSFGWSPDGRSIAFSVSAAPDLTLGGTAQPTRTSP